MSVLGIGGRRFAAGLYWLERGNAASVARNARAFRRPWHVHWGGQTGYAADDGEPQGCPSLAASLQAHVGTPSWMALVEADDGRVALVKARDGSILADGDEVFADKAPALEAFERVRDSGWALHATAGHVDGEVNEIDPASLADDPAMRLVAVPLSWVSLPKAGRFLALAAVVAGAALAWTQQEALWRLVAGPERVAEAEQVPVDPPVTAALDAAALIAGCRQALKHGVRLCLASQRHEDFGHALVELANRIWVLGAGGKKGELEALSKVFELGGTVADAVSYRLTGPGPEGAPALLIASHAKGRFEQVVVNMPGPVELWALTTSPRDAALRERLHARLAPADARAALARRFPAGTARDWIEAELRRLELRGARVAASESDLLERLADELAQHRTTVGTMTERRPERC